MITNHPQNGITPHIGDNNNWFIGTNDTGVRAIGQTTTSIGTITLLASDWVDGQQTVTCNGISSDETSQNISISPSLENEEMYIDSGIYCSAFSDNSLTFTADIIPTEDLVVNVAIERAGEIITGDIYSIEETVVGTWIDGKPVYRRSVFTTTPTSASGALVSGVVTAWSMDLLIHMYGALQEQTGWANTKYPVNIHYRQGNGINCCIFQGDLYIGELDVSYRGLPIVVIVEYTKTTDNATIAIPSATEMMEAYGEGVNEA